MDKMTDSRAAEAQAQGGASADRMAIKLLVAAGFVTEAKANEALNIAHGFGKGPLAPPSAPVGVEGVGFKKAREFMAAAYSDAGCFSAADKMLRTGYVTDAREVVALRAIDMALAQQPAADTVTVQQAWEWAGGNPGIKATRKDLEKALRDLDAVCDDADQQSVVEVQAQAVAWRGRGKNGWTFTDSPHAHDIAVGIWEPLYTAPPSVPVGVKAVVEILDRLIREVPMGLGYMQNCLAAKAILAAQPGGSDNDNQQEGT